MIAVIDSSNFLVYIGDSIDLLPGSLLEQDMFGRKSIYRHIEIKERPQGKGLIWNDKLEMFEEKVKSLSPQISMDSLIKENENLKNELNLIKTHLGI